LIETDGELCSLSLSFFLPSLVNFLFDLPSNQFVVLSNNVQIGAATSSVMNAEIALKKGYLS